MSVILKFRVKQAPPPKIQLDVNRIITRVSGQNHSSLSGNPDIITNKTLIAISNLPLEVLNRISGVNVERIV